MGVRLIFIVGILLLERHFILNHLPPYPTHHHWFCLSIKLTFGKNSMNFQSKCKKIFTQENYLKMSSAKYRIFYFGLTLIIVDFGARGRDLGHGYRNWPRYGLCWSGWYWNPEQHELCRPSRGRLRPRRPAQRVLFRIAVPTTTAQTV